MSFILDALKKAERQRDLARVPTLSTVHIPVLTAGRRIGLWVAAGALLIGGGASIWLWRPSRPAAPPGVTNPRPQASTALPGSSADPTLTPVPARAIETVPPISIAPVPPRPVVVEQAKMPQQPSAAPATTPRSIQAPQMPSSASDTLAAASSGGVRGGGGRSIGSPVGQLPDSPTPPLEPTPVPPAPVFTVPAPPQAPPSPGANPPAAVMVAPPPAKPPTPPTLVDAMAKMRLDTFVYTDVPADRLVIINGQKYVEGEQVDGLYRIESITRDGALLSYKDEKLLLRP